jgi:hypothetical protein
LIQQPTADWEHLHEGSEFLLLLQQLLTAPPQSNPIPLNQHMEEEREHDTEDNPRIEEKIAAQCQQTNITKREKFKNPFFVKSYLAASGDGKGVNLTICIGDIPLAGEKHLPVAVNASMAAGRTTPLCYAHSRGYTNKQSTHRTQSNVRLPEEELPTEMSAPAHVLHQLLLVVPPLHGRQ